LYILNVDNSLPDKFYTLNFIFEFIYKKYYKNPFINSQQAGFLVEVSGD